MDEKRKLRRMVILWCTSYLLVGLLGLVRTVPAKGYHIFTVIAAAVYFIPLLLAIFKHARQLQNKGLMVSSAIICVSLVIWDVFSMIGLLIL